MTIRWATCVLSVLLGTGVWAAPRPEASRLGFAVRAAGSAVAGGKLPVSITIANRSSRPISFILLPTEVRMTFACHGPTFGRRKAAFKEVLQHDPPAAPDDEYHCKGARGPAIPMVRESAVVSLPAGGVLQREAVLDLAQVPPGVLSASFRFRLLRAGPGVPCDKPELLRGEARITADVIAGGAVSLFSKRPLLDGCVRGPSRPREQRGTVHHGEISGCVDCPVSPGK